MTTTECVSVSPSVYIVRVATKFRDNGQPRRYGWVTAQFGPQAVLLRASTTHPKRVARAWAKAWASEPVPTEPLGTIQNLTPAGGAP